MNKRDLQIIKDVERFRVLSRDDIIDLYFSNLKNPVTSANIVLKRLVRDRQISVSKYYSPFVYLPIHSTVKQNSTKIPHFLQIVEVYKILKHALAIKQFIVEPKFQKGLAEPDMLVMLNNVSLFIEIQRNTYSQKVMNKKIKRYEELSSSEQFRNKKFPFIILISNTKYDIETDLKVFQVTSINEFIGNLNSKNYSLHKKEKVIYQWKL